MDIKTEDKVKEYIQLNSSDISDGEYLKLFKEFNQVKNGFEWHVFISYVLNCGINPIEYDEMLPSEFFWGASAEDLDFIVPAKYTKFEFRNCTFRSIKFENPNCKVQLQEVNAQKIILPEQIKFDGSYKIIDENVNATVIIPSGVDVIEDGSISNNQSKLILNIDKQHIPEWGENVFNIIGLHGNWKVTKNTVRVR